MKQTLWSFHKKNVIFFQLSPLYENIMSLFWFYIMSYWRLGAANLYTSESLWCALGWIIFFKFFTLYLYLFCNFWTGNFLYIILLKFKLCRHFYCIKMIQKSVLVHFHGLRAVSMPNKVISGPRKKFDVENWPIRWMVFFKYFHLRLSELICRTPISHKKRTTNSYWINDLHLLF